VVLIHHTEVALMRDYYQQYTQRGGRRPFGISTLIVGYDTRDKVPRLYQTDPSGSFSAWQACAVGRNEKTVREFLEKNYVADVSEEDAIKLAVRALLEVVESGSKNVEVAVLRFQQPLHYLSDEQVEQTVAVIEKEKEEAEASKKSKKATTSK
jgi:20S proteasome subunit alpha 4